MLGLRAEPRWRSIAALRETQAARRQGRRAHRKRRNFRKREASAGVATRRRALQRDDHPADPHGFAALYHEREGPFPAVRIRRRSQLLLNETFVLFVAE